MSLSLSLLNQDEYRIELVASLGIVEEEVLMDFDIFYVVGANKPLQLVDSRVSVKIGEAIVTQFKGISSSPLVTGTCIRKALTLLEVPSAEKKVMRKQSVEKFENRIQELTTQCQRKIDEWYQAWMFLTAANDQAGKEPRNWFSSIIVGLAQNSNPVDGLSYFSDMRASGFGSTDYSVSVALHASVELGA
ncbi:kinesin-like protein KIN-14R, partial [Tanacetum coccineum]